METLTHNIEDTNCAECGIVTGPDADWMSTLHGETCSRNINAYRAAKAEAEVQHYLVMDGNPAALGGERTIVGIYTDLERAEAKYAERAALYKPHARDNVRLFAITEVAR